MKQMNRDLRERAVLPILIPIAAIVLTEIVVFSLSRVLLVTGHYAAVVAALVAAVAILLGCAFVAARPRLSTATVGALLVLFVVAAVGAGAWSLTQKPFYEREAEANRPTVEIAAANLAFDTEELEIATGGTVIEFANSDTQPHNVAIFDGDDATAAVLFRGETINGGQSIDYEVPAVDAGEYYFHCDVHPNMNGTAVAAPAEDGAPAEH